MKTIFLTLILVSGLANAEIYKCTVNGLITYGDVPCKKGTGGEVAITYDKPTPEQVDQSRSDLKRRSDDADARLHAWKVNSAIDEQIARDRQIAYDRKQRLDASLKRLDDISKKLDTIDRTSRRDPSIRRVSPYDH